MPHTESRWRRVAPILSAAILSLLTTTTAASQAQYPVGDRAHAFRNPTGRGSKFLNARVYYPARTIGENAPLLREKGPFPVLVFVNGLHRTGIEYVDLGFELAKNGYIGIMASLGDDLDKQLADARAFVPSLFLENLRIGSFFYGAMRTNQVAIGGHSAGAHTAIRVLSNNLGYVAGVCIAAWEGPTNNRASKSAGTVNVPVVMVAGEGDTVTPWLPNSKVIYDKITSFRGTKALYLMNAQASHSNLVAWTFPRSTTVDREVFDRSSSVAISFLDTYVQRRVSRFENVAGWAARSEKRLTRVELGVRDPLVWTVGDARIGNRVELRVVGQRGFSEVNISKKRASYRTPFGVLGLDPFTSVVLGRSFLEQTGLLSVDVEIPDNKDWQGLEFWLQGLAVGGPSYRYSNVGKLQIR